LKSIGRVLHRARNGYIIAVIESGKLPPLNTPVYLSGGRRVGILLDIIGPINQPYAVIKPDVNVEAKPGDALYYRPPMRRRGGRRGAKRGRRSRPGRRGGG
jgi:RNA-binding protein